MTNKPEEIIKNDDVDTLKKELSELKKQFSDTFKEMGVINPYADKSNEKKKRYIDLLPVVLGEKEGVEIREDCPIIKHGEMEVQYLNGGRQQCTCVLMVKTSKGDKQVKIDVNEFLRKRKKELVEVEKVKDREVVDVVGTVEIKEKKGGRITNKGTGVEVAQAVKSTVIDEIVVKRPNGDIISINPN